MTTLPAWIDIVVAALLAFSGVLVLVSAIGFLRLQAFFLRMHPPALAYTLGSWCVAAAGVLYFSALEGRLMLHPLLIPVLLAMTVPVTTVLLARVALFRQRTAGAGDGPRSVTQSERQARPSHRSGTDSTPDSQA
jgi:multicomponent K+:H+ antiporter subunit G